MRTLIVIFISVAFVVTSCKKYPDGPDISLRSKAERLANTWRIDEWFTNGVNHTSDAQGLFKDYTMIIDKGGAYSVSYKLGGLLPVSQTGNWTFNGDKTKVVFTQTTPSADTVEWTILKLMENDLWGQFTDSTNTIKVQLIPY